MAIAMLDALLCKICGKRKAKRACPAVGGDICTICCGTEREVTLSCPLECEYLQEGHRHEKAVPIAEREISNREVEVTEEFIAAHEELFLFCAHSVLQAALRTSGAVDSDVLEALDGLIRTRKTLESGLVYETVSPNAIAASVQRGVSASLADYEKERIEREALSPVRNSEMIQTLVFLHRIGQHNQNGRRRGRMFIGLLRQMAPEMPVNERAPTLIL